MNDELKINPDGGHLLYWGKIEKARSPEEHANMYSADGAPPGVYASNMSPNDELLWRAKYIGGENRRVEIRTSELGVNLVLIVYADFSMKVSMNGTAWFDLDGWINLQQAVKEAQDKLTSETSA